MSAPERIYLQGMGDPLYPVTWCRHQVGPEDVEYVRADLCGVLEETEPVRGDLRERVAEIIEDYAIEILALLSAPEPVEPSPVSGEVERLRKALEEGERELRVRLSDDKWLRMGLTDGASLSQRTVDAVFGPIRRALEGETR